MGGSSLDPGTLQAALSPPLLVQLQHPWGHPPVTPPSVSSLGSVFSLVKAQTPLRMEIPHLWDLSLV